MTSKSLSINDWLLTEAVRHQEEAGGRRRDDAAALAVARDADTRDQRLAARARALPGSKEALADIKRLRSIVVRMVIGLMLLGLIGGVVAARAGMSAREIDILLISVTLLGLPTLMLLAWLVLLLLSVRSRQSGSVLGSLLVGALVRIAPRLLDSSLSRELVRAGVDLLRGPFGRWYLSGISQLFWLAYAAGAVITLVLFFSIVQYDLSWGTTLLADETVIGMIRALAALPAGLGLIPPVDPGWVAAGREGDLIGAERATWARFVLAMVVLYGAGPRLLLGLVCALLGLAAARQLSLDQKLPGYLRLMPLLEPAPAAATVHGTRPAPAAPRARRTSPARSGPAVLVGIELERSSGHWPPVLPGPDVQVLGQVNRRAQRRELEAALHGLPRPPRAVLALCSMLRTPDAGIEDLLNRLADAADSALILIVDEAGQLARRGGDVETRWADWQDLAARTGGRALLLDLNKPDDAALRQLSEWLDGPGRKQ